MWREVKMKREIVTLFAASAAVFLVACGSDSSGTNANDGEIVSVQAETFDDLPNCSKSREGDLAEVQDERKAYRCQKGAWEFDHDVLDTVKTEDELPACIGKKEGLSLFVKSESAAYTCDGKRWIKEDAPGESGVVEYETEDDLPNCVVKREGETALIEGEAYLCDGTRWKAVGTYYATEDSLSNCTAKRDGETAYIADEGTALKCTDGEWKEVKAAEQGRSEPDDDSPKSSSSTSDIPTSSSTPDTPTSSSTPIEDLSSSSIKVPEPEEGTLTDSRDGQTYKTVVIGTQTWMAENLNYAATSSVCPLENSAYCKKYGRLYLPGGASTYCPSGWHVPSLSEWTVLYNYVDANNGTEGVGKSLKSTTGWYEAGTTVGKRMAVATGKDQFGFSALPAGSCWWDTPSWNCYSDDDARFIASGGEILQMLYDSDIITQEENSDGTNVKVSVRCLKGAATSASSAGNTSSANVDVESSSSYVGKDSSYYDAKNNTLTDYRDNQVYRATTIGTQIWMAENLNYEAAGSRCAGESGATENGCSVDGRLYSWAAAIDSIALYDGGKGVECGYGKTCTLPTKVRGICPMGWHLPSGEEFTMLLAADDFCYDGGNEQFWSSTEADDYSAYYMYLYPNYGCATGGVEIGTYNKLRNVNLVRCLKDSI